MHRPPEGVVEGLPTQPGVYRFRAGDGSVLYIGRAADLRRRVASYWSDLRDRRHLVPMVAAVQEVEAVVCDSRHEAAWLERNLLEAELPRWNRTAGGQEVPVRIELDPGPTHPGLRVVHLPADRSTGRCFGPYLGGLQVRRAVSALDRIHPLSYTGRRLSGSEQALAERRGVHPVDRHAVVEALTAVLSREPAAVERTCAELEAVRGRAVAAEAFELAGRIEAELQGLHWVTSPQRVTSTESWSGEASGWSAGILVTFGMHDGRLTDWRQRRCDRADAEDRPAATPPSSQALALWLVRFAQRNAELAAALRSRQA